MDSKTKYGLLVLAEELGEMQKEVHKALRFGLYDENPHTGDTNLEAMKMEFNDIVGALQYLENNKDFDNFVNDVDWCDVYTKVDKIEDYYQYSVERGWA